MPLNVTGSGTIYSIGTQAATQSGPTVETIPWYSDTGAFYEDYQTGYYNATSSEVATQTEIIKEAARLKAAKAAINAVSSAGVRSATLIQLSKQIDQQYAYIGSSRSGVWRKNFLGTANQANWYNFKSQNQQLFQQIVSVIFGI